MRREIVIANLAMATAWSVSLVYAIIIGSFSGIVLFGSGIVVALWGIAREISRGRKEPIASGRGEEP